MIICLCQRVSDRDIRRAVHGGVRDFDALQEETGVARNCASCHDCAKEIFDQACGRLCASNEPVVAPVKWVPGSGEGTRAAG
jgi:bacterioferritin-associated ferredoxin